MSVIIELEDKQAELVAKILQEWCDRFDRNLTDQYQISVTLMDVPEVQDVIDALNNGGNTDAKD